MYYIIPREACIACVRKNIAGSSPKASSMMVKVLATIGTVTVTKLS